MSKTIGSKKRIYNKFNLSKEILKKEYKKIGNCKKIGEKYGYSETTIRKWMRKFNISFRKTWDRGGHNIFPIKGKRFGKLVVLEKQERREFDNTEAKWICQCDCGNKIITGSNRLRKGLTKSCGCLRSDRLTYNSVGDLSHAYWSRIVKGAKIRSLDFDITPEYCWDLFVRQNKKCALTGEDIFLLNPYSSQQTASLDRIDSSKGYTKKNIQWVHKAINRLKNSLSESELIDWSKKIHEFQNSKRSNG